MLKSIHFQGLSEHEYCFLNLSGAGEPQGFFTPHPAFDAYRPMTGAEVEKLCDAVWIWAQPALRRLESGNVRSILTRSGVTIYHRFDSFVAGEPRFFEHEAQRLEPARWIAALLDHLRTKPRPHRPENGVREGLDLSRPWDQQ